MVIRNMMACSMCLLASKIITQVTAANEVLVAKLSLELLKKQEEPAVVETKADS